MNYQWYQGSLTEFTLLTPLQKILDSDVQFFGPSLPKPLPNRIEWDGLFSFIGKCDGVEVGVLFSDFRIFGGSFGTENAKRAREFLQILEARQTPCLFFLDALGVRFMEGRTVLKDAFSLIPSLANFAEKNLLITVSKGNTLGIAAFYFRQGHYRFAIKDKSQINLTGPEVIRLFFGESYDFQKLASAERQLETRRTVQELHTDLPPLLERIRNLIHVCGRKPLPESFYEPRKDPELKSFIKAAPKSVALEAILPSLGSCFEIFEQTDAVLRVFLVWRKGEYFGLIANNLGHSNNMVGPKGFAKFSDAFKLFERLKVPVMTLIDTPGGDPRQAGENVCIIEEMTQAMLSIYHYPFRKLGVVAGRSYGGASLLGMPKAAGGDRVVVIAGSPVGIMHKSILRDILKKSPSILEKWEKAFASETETLEDLLANDSIDRVISWDELGPEIDSFLLEDKRMDSLDILAYHSLPRRDRGAL